MGLWGWEIEDQRNRSRGSATLPRSRREGEGYEVVCRPLPKTFSVSSCLRELRVNRPEIGYEAEFPPRKHRSNARTEGGAGTSRATPPSAHHSEAKSHNSTFTNEISMRKKVCTSADIIIHKYMTEQQYFVSYANRFRTSTLSSRMWDFASERSDVKSCTFKKM